MTLEDVARELRTILARNGHRVSSRSLAELRSDMHALVARIEMQASLDALDELAAEAKDRAGSASPDLGKGRGPLGVVSDGPALPGATGTSAA